MLKIRGADVAPLEVELALNGLPMIERSAVVGVDALGGTTLVAAVQLRAERAFDEDEARAALRGRLSSFKIPKRLFVLAAEDFPIIGSGKVKKAALAERLGARVAAFLPKQSRRPSGCPSVRRA
jgi:acyl-CoA synthetase (AMP-forming)/AMP-acid ligase II